MKKVAIGTAATVTFPMTDLNDDPVSPTALSYVVLDGDGAEIVPETSVAAQDTALDITVPADKNMIAGGRTIVLSITTGDGTFDIEETYVVSSQLRLVAPDNSFMTLAQAYFLAEEMPDVTRFTSASKEEQSRALLSACLALKRIPYIIRWPTDVDMQSRLVPSDVDRIRPEMWPLMTLDLLLAYPDEFIQALRRAQLAEANQILTVDPIVAKRRAGLLSETIGESSMMFRPGVKPLDLPISRAAMTYLSGYVDNCVTLIRT